MEFLLLIVQFLLAAACASMYVALRRHRAVVDCSAESLAEGVTAMLEELRRSARRARLDLEETSRRAEETRHSLLLAADEHARAVALASSRLEQLLERAEEVNSRLEANYRRTVEGAAGLCLSAPTAPEQARQESLTRAQGLETPRAPGVEVHREYQKVLGLAQQGIDRWQIARQAGVGQEEIGLLLKVRATQGDET